MTSKKDIEKEIIDLVMERHFLDLRIRKLVKEKNIKPKRKRNRK